MVNRPLPIVCSKCMILDPAEDIARPAVFLFKLRFVAVMNQSANPELDPILRFVLRCS